MADYVNQKGFYPAGRLDKDSEGLVLLTSDGQLQARIAHPKNKMPKTYWVHVEGAISNKAIDELKRGVSLKDLKTRPAQVKTISPPLPERDPPVRTRKEIPTTWIELVISEGKNRQVRRMTAAVGFPTLRLYRAAIGPWQLEDLRPGEWRSLKVNLPR